MEQKTENPKVLTFEEAQKHLAEKGKMDKKTLKELKRQEQYMKTMITRGEAISMVQETVDRLHDERFIPIMEHIRAINNLAEVLTEALIRKGVLTVDFLKEVQAELIEKALQQQKEEAERQDSQGDQVLPVDKEGNFNE